MVSYEGLSEKQTEIVRRLCSIILDIVAQSGKTPGKSFQVTELYQAIADHFSTSIDRIVTLGNRLVWSALYLLQSQGWVQLEAGRPRIRVVKVPQHQ